MADAEPDKVDLIAAKQAMLEQHGRANVVKLRDEKLREVADLEMQLAGMPTGNRHERRKALKVARVVARKAAKAGVL